jgi:hypothetical protein
MMTIDAPSLKAALERTPRGPLLIEDPDLDLLVHNAVFGGGWRFIDEVVREIGHPVNGHAVLPCYTTDVTSALALVVTTEVASCGDVWDLVSRATAHARRWPSYMPTAHEWGLILAKEIVYQVLIKARDTAKVAA